jgi:4-hydroxy 2-oxovalerate aldolase
MIITDCTIRDGGHTNNWEFSDELVRKTYHAATQAGVDFFELGYISNKLDRGFYGKMKLNGNHGLEDIETQKCKIIGMIDCDRNTEIDWTKAENSQFKYIRLATYSHNIDIALNLIPGLILRGYKVFLSLMGFCRFQNSDLKYLSRLTQDFKDSIEAITFADSFGSMLPEEVLYCYLKLRDLGFSRVNFHAHNNTQLAFANVLKLLKTESPYGIDASVYGMGRGGGNLPIELLIRHLRREGINKYWDVPYLKLINSHFYRMKEDFYWGYNTNTLEAGIAGVHPYYADYLDDNNVDEIWREEILFRVQKELPVNYDEDKISELIKDVPRV